MRRKRKEIIITFLICIGYLTILFININTKEDFTDIEKNQQVISKIDVISYDTERNTVLLKIESPFDYEECTLNVIQSQYSNYVKKENNTCEIYAPLNNKSYIYLKADDKVTEPIELNNYLVDIVLDDIYYLPLNNEINLNDAIIKVGNPNLEINIEGESVVLEEGILKNNAVGTSVVNIKYNSELVKAITIVSTNTIVDRPYSFNEQKPYLACGQFTNEEAELLDKILVYQVEQAGYGTRAGVVEAARFLTLSFPYRISYYWENGRLHPSGQNYVDGEGRYYHRGLYLSESKYSTLAASISGPQMWGCYMTNWEEDEPFFIRGRKYPNGLDCSGFVSWTLLNGGFDVGDKGAGNSGYKYELSDLGEFTSLTRTLINSDTIKVGDLMSTPGHIAILIGIDDENYYVAESLNNLGGVKMVTYSKKTVNQTFTHVVLMDEVYKNDGNLTNMWY